MNQETKTWYYVPARLTWRQRWRVLLGRPITVATTVGESDPASIHQVVLWV